MPDRGGPLGQLRRRRSDEAWLQGPRLEGKGEGALAPLLEAPPDAFYANELVSFSAVPPLNLFVFKPIIVSLSLLVFLYKCNRATYAWKNHSYLIL
jgi:hypothetical protein